MRSGGCSCRLGLGGTERGSVGTKRDGGSKSFLGSCIW